MIINKDGKEYKVRISHRRLSSRIVSERGTTRWTMQQIIKYAKKVEDIKGPIFPRGGVTYVSVKDEEGNIYIAKSVCSIKDNFNKKLGRKIAVGRAIENYNYMLGEDCED